MSALLEAVPWSPWRRGQWVIIRTGAGTYIGIVCGFTSSRILPKDPEAVGYRWVHLLRFRFSSRKWSKRPYPYPADTILEPIAAADRKGAAKLARRVDAAHEALGSTFAERIARAS